MQVLFLARSQHHQLHYYSKRRQPESKRLLNHLLARPPCLNLLLGNLPQLVNSWCASSNNTLGHLQRSRSSVLPNNRVRRRDGLDADDTDTRVLWAAVVLTIFEVTEPRLQCWRVVLADRLAVGVDLGGAADGSPFAGTVKEGNVDVGVGLKVVGLAGLGVGVEDEIDTAVLL